MKRSVLRGEADEVGNSVLIFVEKTGYLLLSKKITKIRNGKVKVSLSQ